MARYKFPKIKKFTKEQRLYLEQVYQDFKDGKVRDILPMTADLSEVLSPNFSAFDIDPRLLHTGRAPVQTITILGIWHVDPNSPLFETCDKVIGAVRTLLLEHYRFNGPNTNEQAAFTFDEIARKSGISIDDIRLVYNLLIPLGGYWSNYIQRDPITGEEFGIKVIGINPFNDYRSYTRIDDLHWKLKNEERAKQKLWKKTRRDSARTNVKEGVFSKTGVVATILGVVIAAITFYFYYTFEIKPKMEESLNRHISIQKDNTNRDSNNNSQRLDSLSIVKEP